MFLVSTRNFPPEVGGMQNLMEGLSNSLLNHGPVKVFADGINNSDIYDLASITKIASSALILMQQESLNNFNVDSTLGFYLPNILDSTDYGNLIIKEVLTHQAGLASWIPFYIQTLNDGIPSYELYSKLPSSIHQNLVAKNLYMLSSYRDTIFNRILATDIGKNKDDK